MHGRDRQVMMIVLHARQPAGELSFVVVIDIAQGTDAVLGSPGIQLRVAECSSHEIAECLGAASIAFLLDQPIKRVCQVIVY
jgi:hypothetical protein